MNQFTISSFLGPLEITWSHQGLENLEIRLDAVSSEIPKDLPEWLYQFVQEIKLYLEEGRAFTRLPPVNESRWTAFQKQIYLELFATRRGETLTYGELAKRCQRPLAARSVGAAMSRNKLPILIPCHRVLPAGGKLGQYTGGEGPLSKEKLLRFEKSFERGVK